MFTCHSWTFSNNIQVSCLVNICKHSCIFTHWFSVTEIYISLLDARGLKLDCAAVMLKMHRTLSSHHRRLAAGFDCTQNEGLIWKQNIRCLQLWSRWGSNPTVPRDLDSKPQPDTVITEIVKPSDMARFHIETNHKPEDRTLFTFRQQLHAALVVSMKERKKEGKKNVFYHLCRYT